MPSSDPIQSFAMLYVVRVPGKSPHTLPRRAVDHYDVCYTKTGDQVRIASVVAIRPEAPARRNRVYQAASPEVWETVRKALLSGSGVFFESDALNLVGRRRK